MLRRESFSPIQWLLLAVFTVYCLLPLWWVITTMFKDNGQLFSTFGLWFSAPSHLLENINTLFTRQDGIFSRWLLNSVIYAGATALGSVMVSAMAGYAFSKFDFAAKRGLFTLILATIMVPSTALALPIYLLMQKTGLLNTYWAVILPGVVNPFGLYLMRLFWDAGFPKELMEAARIDGASEPTIFWSLGMPLVRGGLVTVGLFAFLAGWNEFFAPLIMLTDPAKQTLPVAVANLRQQTMGQIDYGATEAGVVVMALPCVILFLLLQRYYVRGFMSGAVKG